PPLLTDPAPPVLSRPSLHDALPIFSAPPASATSAIPQPPASSSATVSSRPPASCCRQKGRSISVSTMASPARKKMRPPQSIPNRSEEHTSELQSRETIVCRLLLDKK